MKKFYLAFSAMLCSLLLGVVSANAASTQSDNYMPEGTVVFPTSVYTTYLIGADLTWNYEPLEFTNPSDTPTYWGYERSATPATLTIEGVEGTFNLYPYIYEDYDYEETPDGEYNFIYFYTLCVDFDEDDILSQAGLSDYPFGKYTIVIPAGIVKNELGALNPDQTVVIYYMDSPDFDTETFNPPAVDSEWQPIEYAADDLSEVSLTWDNMPITLNENSSPATVSQYSWMGDTPKTPFIYGENLSLNDDKNAIIFNLKSLPVGRWTIIVPEGFVFLGEDQNMINDEVQATYTITKASGVTSLDKDENGRWVVYNLKGVLLLDTNNDSELQNLEPGLYVINGEKVLIRR